MGLFGEVDANDIPDNPFYVAPGVYPAVLTEIKAVEPKNDGGKHGIAFKWVIDDEDSEYNGQNVQDWKTYYPDLSPDDLTPQVKRDLANLRQVLNSLGLTPDEQNEFLENMDEYVGTNAVITVKETPDKNDPDKKYTNVVKIVVDE